MKKTLLLFVVALCAFGGDFEDGLEAYAKADFKTAFDKFSAACEANNGDACTKLGSMYYFSRGVKADKQKRATQIPKMDAQVWAECIKKARV